MTVSCDEFLEAVKRLITAPTQQELLEDEDILAFGTDIIRDSMVPLMLSVDQDYFVTRGPSIPIPVGATSVAIPGRAVARKLREVKLVTPDGAVIDFPKVNLTRASLYSNNQAPFGFYLLGDKLELTSAPLSSGYAFQLFYPVQPGRLIKLESAAKINDITGNDVTVVSLPDGFDMTAEYDFIDRKAGNWFKGIEASVTNIAGSTLSFEPGTVPTDLAVGDYITLTGYSPFLQILDEGAPLLQTLTAQDCLGSISDFEGQERLEKKLKRQTENFTKLIAPRVDGEPNVIINDRSLLRGRRGSFNRFRMD